MTAIHGDPLRSDTKKKLLLLQCRPKKGVKNNFSSVTKVELPYTGRAIVDNRRYLVAVQLGSQSNVLGNWSPLVAIGFVPVH